MLIISHRGFWKKAEEKNTLIAFDRSFSHGFGTELDVRDYCGRLVISHDIADSRSVDFEDFLKIYCKYNKRLFLAINIKSDGLQKLLFTFLKKYHIKDYFVFDMSIPDTLGYLNFQMKIFMRESEFETIPSFYEEADGIWMDEFSTHWITVQKIKKHLSGGKKVCLVSPELHQREHLTIWKEYKILTKNFDTNSFIVCTDYPEHAKEAFYD